MRPCAMIRDFVQKWTISFSYFLRGKNIQILNSIEILLLNISN